MSQYAKVSMKNQIYKAPRNKGGYWQLEMMPGTQEARTLCLPSLEVTSFASKKLRWDSKQQLALQ